MYIGNDLQIANPSYKIIDDISSSFNGSTTSFALQVSGVTPVPFPINEQQVMISVNGVVQEPDPSGSAGFKLLGSNIIFSSAPANGNAFFGVILAGADYVTAGSEFPDGTVNAPSFTFSSDQDSGWFRIGSGSTGYTSNGVQTLNFDGNGLTIAAGKGLTVDTNTLHVDATNNRVGIGLTSPATTLHLNGAGPILRLADTTDPQGVDGSIGKIEFYGSDGSSSGVGVRSYIQTISTNATGNAHSLTIGISAANAAPSEVLRINDAGNVGIGITPDAHGSDVTSIQLGSSSNLYNDSSDDYTILGDNVYFDGANNKYIRANESSRLMQNAGQLWFQQAASGSADANITYTTPFFIKSDGSVGIGTTSPTLPLNVLTTGNDAAIFESTSGNEHGVQVTFRSSSASPADNDKLAVLDFSGKDNAGNNTTYAQIRSHSRDVTNNSEDGDITFHTRLDGAFAERMRLHSSGLLSIGDDPAGAATYGGDVVIANTDGGILTLADTVSGERLHIEGGAGFARIGTESNHDLVFFTNGTGNERMRLDNSGRLLLGTTTEGDSNADDLTIATTGNTGITIRSGVNNIGAIYFSDATTGGGEYKGYVQYDQQNDNLKLGCDSETIVWLHADKKLSVGYDSTGYGQWSFLNIGASGADATGGATGLTIRSDTGPTNASVLSNTTSTLKLNNNAYAGTGVSGSTGTVVKILFNGATSNGWNAYGAIGLDVVGTSGGKGDLFFNTGGEATGYERMRIKNTGLVGIGTDSPDQLLHLEGSSTAIIRLTDTDTAAADNSIIGGIEFETKDSNGAGVNASMGAYIKDTTNGDAYLAFKVGTAASTYAEALRIDSGGLKTANGIGIGMDRSGSTLAVNGNILLGAGGNTSWSKVSVSGSGGSSGDDFAINNWGDVEGDYWTFGVNSTTNQSGNEAKTNDAKRSASITLDGRMGRMMLHTSQTSTSTIDQTHVWDRGGDYTLTGNVVVAAGKGINFSAYATSGNPRSNLLDDYEEGTITLTCSNGGLVLTNNDSGYDSHYVKIGRLVHVQFYVGIGSGTHTGSVLEFDGLPFDSAPYQYAVGTIDFGKGGKKGAYMRITQNSNNLQFFYSSENTSNSRLEIVGTDIGTSTYAIGTMTYYTDADN